MPLQPPSPASMTAVILAGGEGRRMHGQDKGLIELAGQPLITRAIDSLRPQVAQLLISANRSLDAYRSFGYPVIADADRREDEPFAGPLAGVLAALRAMRTKWLLTLPCDTPSPPPDLAERLADAIRQQPARLACARTADGLQPAHALLHASLADDLAKALAGGERKLLRWIESHDHRVVDFADQPQAFCNLNTPADLDALEQRLAGNEPL